MTHPRARFQPKVPTNRTQTHIHIDRRFSVSPRAFSRLASYPLSSGEEMKRSASNSRWCESSLQPPRSPSDNADRYPAPNLGSTAQCGPSATPHFYGHYVACDARVMDVEVVAQANPISSSWMTKLNPGGFDDGSFGRVGK